VRAEATDDQIKEILGECGPIKSLFVSSHPQHPTKFALVSFESHENALAAIEKLNDRSVPPLTDAETKLYVGRAVKKSDRSKPGPQAQSLYQSQGRNIYVKHLEDGISAQGLESLFAQFGKITSCALMKDSNGNFRGFGFVCFETKESATAAIREMNGKVISRRPLYVSQAQQRDMRHQVLDEQRKAMVVQQQRLAMQMNMYGPQWRPGFPMAPFMQQPFGMMPLPQPRRGMMPMRGPNMNVMPGGMPPPRGPGGPPPRLPMQPGSMHMMPPQQQVRYTQPPPAAPRPTGINAAQLAKMTPEEQKNTLGERLYSKISELQPAQAAKITGMLLEMDTPEILNVLEDQRTLLQKVQEAIHVLQQHEAGH